MHRRERRARVHLGRARSKHAVDALGLARREIAREIARVPVEILVGAELQRVHEDRHDHEVGRGRRRPHQRPVAVVQKTHRRHHADPLPADTVPRGARVVAGSAQVGDPVDVKHLVLASLGSGPEGSGLAGRDTPSW